VRTITYFTGSRSEYGLMRSLLKSMAMHPGIKLGLIVSGMHLSRRHGYSVEEVKRDGFEIIEEISILSQDESETSMAESFGRCVIGVANALNRSRPDILLVQGDRSETLAAAIAAAHLNIPIAHMSGGDITLGGIIDDRIRPAISALAHIHLPSTKRSADVLIKRGEEPWRVHFVGNPGVNLRDEEYTDSRGLANKLGIDPEKDLVVVVQHPVEPEEAKAQMEETMAAVKEAGMQAVVIYPNSDAGSRDIIEVIKKYEGPSIKAFPTLSRRDFVGLLRMARVLVGNSSCGIVEAPSLNLAVVNIGLRQEGRETMSNVINADHNRDEIVRAIKRAMNMKAKTDMRKMPYYAEDTNKKVIEVLLKTELGERLLRKKTMENFE